MSTSHLQDILIFVCLFLKLGCQGVKCLIQDMCLINAAYLHACWECIIRGLCHISMVVRAHYIIASTLLTHKFKGSITKNLVHVHVDRCSCATLYRIQGELIIEFAISYLICSLNHQVSNTLIETTCLHICEHSCFLYFCKGMYEI